MSRKTCIVLAALTMGLGAVAAAPAFEKVPEQANAALKGARGKPVRSGLVFINGHYLKPPYVVARYGTAIYINNVQATGQVVPWRTFLGVGAAAPAQPAPAKKAAKPSSSIDDLFDDAPPAAPATPAQAAPQAQDSGEFVLNARTKSLLRRIDEYRKDINKRLLTGQACFMGVRYSPVFVPSRLCSDMLGMLPEAMRDAADGADLAARMRRSNYLFMNAELCDDIMGNRADYPALIERRTQLREDEKLQNMIRKGQQGIVP